MAYEDIRLAPSSSLLQELDVLELGEVPFVGDNNDEGPPADKSSLVQASFVMHISQLCSTNRENGQFAFHGHQGFIIRF